MLFVQQPSRYPESPPLTHNAPAGNIRPRAVSLNNETLLHLTRCGYITECTAEYGPAAQRDHWLSISQGHCCIALPPGIPVNRRPPVRRYKERNARNFLRTNYLSNVEPRILYLPSFRSSESQVRVSLGSFGVRSTELNATAEPRSHRSSLFQPVAVPPFNMCRSDNCQTGEVLGVWDVSDLQHASASRRSLLSGRTIRVQLMVGFSKQTKIFDSLYKEIWKGFIFLLVSNCCNFLVLYRTNK